MASTIDGAQFFLLDHWPSDLNPNWGGPSRPGSATDASDWQGQNLATPTFPLGRKFCVRQEGATGINAGWSTFIYLKLGTSNPDETLAIKDVCTVEGDAFGTSETSECLYTVTDDAVGAATNVLDVCGLVAVCLDAMTDPYYGWFWCGGVCPEVILTGCAGNYETDGNVVAGNMCVENTGANNDSLGFGTQAATETACGISLSGDA